MRKYPKWLPPDPLSIKILKIIGLGIAVTAASLLSPTFLTNLLKRYLQYKLSQPVYTHKQIQRSLYYLKRKKFIAFPARDNSSKIILARLGKKRLSQLQFDNLTIKKIPWDGRWWLLTFDIPEEQSSARHAFRRKLKKLGFFHFQRSVFISPYPCEKEIGQITNYLKISPCVHIIVGQRFPGDETLTKTFDLPNVYH